ncbi:MAG: AEC family transporter [Thermodesulfobacteriota bacterium]
MLPVVDNIVPVFVVILAGRVLVRYGFVPAGFFKASDRLVYYFFFPAMLFWEIGRAGRVAVEGGLLWSVVGAITAGHLLSILYIKASGVDRYLAGSFSQLSFRFNTYVGLAVVVSALGDAGVVHFGLIISVAIPLINVLAVGTLIWFSQGDYSLREKAGLVVKAMLANPLIIACLAGLAWAWLEIGFPKFLNQTFRLITTAALPLALLSIGGSLTLERLRGYLAPALASSAIKLAGLPLAGWVLLRVLGVTGVSFQTAMIYLALPTAATAGILSSQLGSDPDLAAAGVVTSTFLSFFSLSLVLLLFGGGAA